MCLNYCLVSDGSQTTWCYHSVEGLTDMQWRNRVLEADSVHGAWECPQDERNPALVVIARHGRQRDFILGFLKMECGLDIDLLPSVPEGMLIAASVTVT